VLLLIVVFVPLNVFHFSVKFDFEEPIKFSHAVVLSSGYRLLFILSARTF
jgi:hypothetical protein